MIRLIPFFLCLWGVLASPVLAQDLSGLARVDPAESRLTDSRGGAQMTLSLSQGVPYRVFTLTDPARLVLDFREVDWRGLDLTAFDQSEAITGLRAGTFRPGWSRLVAQMDAPHVVDTVGLNTDQDTGRAVLTLKLAKTTQKTFAAAAGAPHDPRWDLPPPARFETPRARNGGKIRVMLDPGHGGIDPGAERGAVNEKTLMLTFARELEEALLRAGGFEVLLTRTGDYFVSLERRIAMAHEAQVDVFISLHADALADGGAHGATIYTLSDEASDVASAKLAERHDRDELLSGVDLSATDDQVTAVLLDLARQETRPRTALLAQSLVTGMGNQGGPMNRRPMRQAAFSVLKAADIPSVLVEIGFLSSPRDLKNLQDPEWRAQMAEGMRDGLQLWLREDSEMRPLVRK
ncbi:N-acetylmuramoyl-L-alanine amidase [Aestuariivita boseongensis]|uniref:N-acetylmuramoyl-L-alanine amidase n=1 Tax=Aestuariivita boseongensis TaxID=1470562 RepID=UPI0006815301|nr:N-acetylmuramoyl-L-alanine amidase [Aestuariivita boseongensis]